MSTVSTNLKIDQIKSDLSSLTALELSELSKALQEEWGVSAAVPVAAAAPAAGGAAAVQEKTHFKFTLKSVPADKKVAAIKVIREILSLSLVDAKTFVESAPKVVKDSASKDEVEAWKTKFAEAGSEIEVE